MAAPTYLSKLPNDTINVSHYIISPISETDTSNMIDDAAHDRSKASDFIRGFNNLLNIQYSLSANEFYIKKGDKYKVLRWRDQKQKDYTYKYVFIPYKKNKPIKILQKSWEKMVKMVM
jgi:hypothetical protein